MGDQGARYWLLALHIWFINLQYRSQLEKALE